MFNRRVVSLEKRLKSEETDFNEALSGKKKKYFKLTKICPEKGFGIVTKKPIRRGEWMFPYEGLLYRILNQKKRRYQLANAKTGPKCPRSSNYIFKFKCGTSRYVLDATKKNVKNYGRFLNHSKKNANAAPILIARGKEVHVVFRAIADIPENTEVLYDYLGKHVKRDPEEESQFPWIIE